MRYPDGMEYLILLWFIRLVYVVFILRTSFVPDEYFQTVEVAYALVTNSSIQERPSHSSTSPGIPRQEYSSHVGMETSLPDSFLSLDITLCVSLLLRQPYGTPHPSCSSSPRCRISPLADSTH